jgi:hypothetical protein
VRRVVVGGYFYWERAHIKICVDTANVLSAYTLSPHTTSRHCQWYVLVTSRMLKDRRWIALRNHIGKQHSVGGFLALRISFFMLLAITSPTILDRSISIPILPCMCQIHCAQGCEALVLVNFAVLQGSQHNFRPLLFPSTALLFPLSTLTKS